jgi:hypothetical protein
VKFRSFVAVEYTVRVDITVVGAVSVYDKLLVWVWKIVVGSKTVNESVVGIKEVSVVVETDVTVAPGLVTVTAEGLTVIVTGGGVTVVAAIVEVAVTVGVVVMVAMLVQIVKRVVEVVICAVCAITLVLKMVCVVV